jgi:transposase
VTQRYFALVFVRRKKNKTGSTSIQIIDTSTGKPILKKSMGWAVEAKEVDRLYQQAIATTAELTGQRQLDLEWQQDAQFAQALEHNIEGIYVLGPELILGKLFSEIGFEIIQEPMFKYIVLARLVYPGSKLKTVEYLMRYNGVGAEVDTVYRFLDKLNKDYKEQLQQISYAHTNKILGGEVTVVFYDVTTLYFEASDEDDLRKTGFSKDGKAQQPQIVLGLLVSVGGYPLAHEVFEGSKFEGHTMLPVIKYFKAKYGLNKLIVVADAGLLSTDNINQLKQHGYEFILGARIKSESDEIKKQILSHHIKDGQSIVLRRAVELMLIVSYSSSRAARDARNRKKGLAKLEKALQNGRLTKQHINNRGYNKYLKLQGQITVTIDYNKYNDDAKWDGLKGYLTNTTLNKEAVIENYKNLWQIEKAFRISKTDLRIRPIYHRLKRRIEAHINIAFCAYKIYKELERQLIQKKMDCSPEKAINMMKTIYGIQVNLPASGKKKTILFAANHDQKKLMEAFDLPMKS